MVGVSTSVNLPLHHKVQKLSSGTISPEWSQKKGHKTVVVVVVVFAPVNLVTEQHMRLLVSYFIFFPTDIHSKACKHSVTNTSSMASNLGLAKY